MEGQSTRRGSRGRGDAEAVTRGGVESLSFRGRGRIAPARVRSCDREYRGLPSSLGGHGRPGRRDTFATGGSDVPRPVRTTWKAPDSRQARPDERAGGTNGLRRSRPPRRRRRGGREAVRARAHHQRDLAARGPGWRVRGTDLRAVSGSSGAARLDERSLLHLSSGESTSAFVNPCRRRLPSSRGGARRRPRRGRCGRRWRVPSTRQIRSNPPRRPDCGRYSLLLARQPFFPAGMPGRKRS